MRIEPSFEEFERLCADHTVVPVSTEIFSDGLTPVMALSRVGQGPGSYLLESVTGGELWARYSFVGFSPSRMLRGRDDRLEIQTMDGFIDERHGDPWEALRQELASFKAPEIEWLPRFWGGAVGYIPYDAVFRFEPRVGKRRAPPLEFSFALGGMLLIFDARRSTVRVVSLVEIASDTKPDARAQYEAAKEKIREALHALSTPAALAPLSPLPLPTQDEVPESTFERSAFLKAVERIKEHIKAGDVFQTVLSQRFTVPLDEVDPFDVYRAMRVINPSPYMYFLRFPEAQIAGASPETLVRLEDGRAHVRPIAGTRPRGETPERDEAIAQELLADPKERAEHVMLVDLGRNDLGRISRAGTVRIEDQMNIERYSHVMHIVSNVSGELRPELDAIDLIRATFPAGTLSGAPKVRAMQIIEELEPEPRGIYGGAVGYIGFDGNLDLAIAIRTAVAQRGQLTLQAGAGIVSASDPAMEYEETLNKARAGLLALKVARGLPKQLL